MYKQLFYSMTDKFYYTLISRFAANAGDRCLRWRAGWSLLLFPFLCMYHHDRLYLHYLWSFWVEAEVANWSALWKKYNKSITTATLLLTLLTFKNAVSLHLLLYITFKEIVYQKMVPKKWAPFQWGSFEWTISLSTVMFKRSTLQIKTLWSRGERGTT